MHTDSLGRLVCRKSGMIRLAGQNFPAERIEYSSCPTGGKSSCVLLLVCVCVSESKCALGDKIILIQLISQHVVWVHAIHNWHAKWMMHWKCYSYLAVTCKRCEEAAGSPDVKPSNRCYEAVRAKYCCRDAPPPLTLWVQHPRDSIPKTTMWWCLQNHVMRL